MDIFNAGRDFVRREGRLVESRLFAAVFEEADAGGVVDALRGYQNADGGFGHGLEPDKRCPDSLALDVQVAFETLLTAGARDDEMVRRAVDWLDSIATPDGAVPLCGPVIEGYPRAEHMTEWTYEPGLNPTAGLVGQLHRFGFEHPWRDKAGAWCAAELAKGFPEDAHGMHVAMEFLEHTDDVDLDKVRDWLPKLNWYRADAADPEYGVTPLHLAPTPDSFWRGLFDDSQLEAHLDRLVADQQSDGGWTLTWEPPGTSSTLAYRGIVTIAALRTLKAYGRL
ncbi:hypothetical protein E1218_06370 [Kribbella turkmenica]|uniref:Prenyltransferase n=1 Tax=Kribbella turkmenica TaxID=2530375 RepID=A0A4R4XDM4_9ACTN|nr:hypothetical protein [Kribbella turkmenica]TDD28734.1 hypothetical protein E1218_06370 [Kribbella turkmenica]